MKTNRIVEFGVYRLDCGARVLLRGETLVPLTPKALDMLIALVERAGRPVPKEELLAAVWPDCYVEESNLAQNVSVLRKALGAAPASGPYIETIPKRGYRFVAEVRVVSGPVSPESSTASVAPAAPSARKRKWISVAIPLVLMISGVAGVWIHRHALTTIHSIAVLPLKDLSADSSQDFVADGITELLTTEFARTLPVRVTSRTSAMLFRNTSKPLAAIAHDLNADAIVEGSVVRTGDRLRVTIQLIQPGPDRHLWAETYDRDLTDLPLLEEEIARAVAREMKADIAPAVPNRAVQVNVKALAAFFRGRYYLDQRTPESIREAISWYRTAISEDPAYARAYAGLADCYNQLGTVMIGGQSPAESRKLAIAAASRAIEIDPELAEAHAALGYSNMYEWNWDSAKQSLERAVRLNPNYAPAHLWYAHYLTARRRFDEGLQEVRLARDLDPLSPIIQTQVGWLLGHAGRFPEALREYRKALAMDPNYQWAQWQLGGALISMGDYNGAIGVLEEAARRKRTASVLGTLGHAYGMAGQRNKSRAVLDELLALSQRQYVPPHCFVHVYIGLRDREKVFEWLEKSYQEHSNSLAWLGTWREVDWLASDPRLDNLMRRVGLK